MTNIIASLEDQIEHRPYYVDGPFALNTKNSKDQEGSSSKAPSNESAGLNKSPTQQPSSKPKESSGKKRPVDLTPTKRKGQDRDSPREKDEHAVYIFESSEDENENTRRPSRPLGKVS